MDWMIQSITEAIVYVLMLPYHSSLWVLEQIVALMPSTDMGPQFATALEWLEIGNYWFPIGETFLAVSVLWTFQGTFIVIKYIVKAIPTVG